MINLLGIPIRDAMRADSWILSLLQEVGYHEKSGKLILVHLRGILSGEMYPHWRFLTATE